MNNYLMIKISMKKSFLQAGLAALLLAGCAQNEITEMSPDAAPPVGFKVFTDAQTRGVITNGSTSVANKSTGIRTTGFGVLAYYTGQSNWNNAGSFTPNFMYNQKVEYKNGAWTYTPVKYWPNTEGDKISFFAYAPYSTTKNSGISITSTASTGGAPTMRFTLQSAPGDMVDLVATHAGQTAANEKTIDVEKKTTNVSFMLKHVLTRASFKAKLDASLKSTAADTHVFITGMRILGTVDNGVNGNASGANIASRFYSAATYKWADGTWDYTTVAPTQQSAIYPLNAIMPLASKTSVINAKYTTEGIELPQEATEITLFKADQFLFLIPPKDITGIEAETDVRMQIDYDIVTRDASLADGYSISSTTATVSLPNETLQRGKAYLYTFTVGLEKVQITASVEEWAPSDNEVFIPSMTVDKALYIRAAISGMNDIKHKNKNCNYFVINCTGSNYGALVLVDDIHTDELVSGDKIELNFTAASPGITSLQLHSSLKADKTTLLTTGKIILTKI